MVRQIRDQFVLYFPPDFSTDRGGLLSGIYQSIAVAVVATVVGLVFAIPIGLAASRNVAGKWTYRTARLSADRPRGARADPRDRVRGRRRPRPG
jgi:ABC-type phosphate/phosphonate transport system permease subunit